MKTAKLILLYIATLMLVVACGGGSESLTRDTVVDDDTQQTTETLTITLAFVDATGASTTTINDGSPLTLLATVTDSDGNAKANEVVSFVLSQAELANFNNDTGTALTGSDGVASIELSAGALSGSGTVTAAIENAESVTIGFQSSGTQQEIPFSLELFASSIQLASSGGDEIELIAVVKNEQNILLSNVPVMFSADENASLTIIDSQTTTDGTARAILSTDNNQEIREITITANTSSLIETVTVEVVGTEVILNGANSVIINDSLPITVVLSDSDGNGIANRKVYLTTSIGSVDNEEPETGENGQITVQFSSSEAGTGKIFANALGATTDLDITVQQDDFSFSSVPELPIVVGDTETIGLRWFKDNSPFENGSIVVTTSRGDINLSNVTTDADGLAYIDIVSEFAGPASISALGTDADGNEVTARVDVKFIATDVDSIFVDATPDLIGPEGQTSTITAVLRDSANNLVQGQTVNFRLIADSSGGSISPNTAITDSNGIASTVYTSNAVSGNNGVTIGAQSDGIDSSTELTVGDRAFDIVLGTGNEVEEEDSTTYTKEFAVFVTDASGRPVSSAALTASIVPTVLATYRKGFWTWNDVDDIYEYTVTASCNSEDINSNGLLDAGEDTNGDGFLTPGNVATVSFKDNDANTNDFGQATLQVRYTQQNAVWSSVKLSVSGQSSGTESRTSQAFGLSVAASDLTTQSVSPPNSPFGQGFVCTDTL